MVAQAEQRKRARKRRSKIWTPGSDTEDIAEAFRAETKFMLEKIALEYGCSVEELKFCTNNLGMINVQRMTEEEMKEAEKNRRLEKFRKEIRKQKGLDD
ncbi:hypothetical protein LCGC14_0756730 [marine sediment metagenome]|uniref:Uncharacterized protein n=1 Tax=marine sediment metagenome TaxID=412755 RepID=A0A0F9QM84_9ZZZZ|nr:hypothetical protein [Pricia sp.]